jgi:polysaccharide export outer membrane protein
MKFSFSLNCFCFIALIVTLNACISKRELVYFQNPKFNSNTVTATNNALPEYKLQPRDILAIRIKTLDKETSEYFNIVPGNSFQQWSPAGFYINGYSIDRNGEVTLPEVGNVKVENLTLEQAQARIQVAVNAIVKNATILVKLVSFKITILGEVNTPGYYYVYNDQATLLDALGLAGDLTDFGSRDNITLIRQTDRGTETILLSLKDPNLMASKYYYLMPNDTIYVQPLRAKLSRGNLSTLGVLSIVFGAVSTAILILNYVN